MNEPGGMNAANLKVAELYIDAFGNLAKTGNTLIVPSNLSDVATLVSSAMTIVSGAQQNEVPGQSGAGGGEAKERDCAAGAVGVDRAAVQLRPADSSRRDGLVSSIPGIERGARRLGRFVAPRYAAWSSSRECPLSLSGGGLPS